MSKIVGVRFKHDGKTQEFDSGHFVLKRGDKVMVITEEGPAIGYVCTEPRVRSGKAPKRPLKKVFRLATEEEVERYERGVELERKVYAFCYQKIRERSLPMRLVCVERRFDGSKVVVYFTADGRVDFRQLVKDLVGKFRTRIEMRQIGVRHQAKMVGGLGPCGRALCCATFLNTFAPVTIKMAKQQNLSLNPSKISGMCGRLMCCLTYEHRYYEKMKDHLPKTGKRVVSKLGEGKVIRQNVLKETLTLQLDSGEEVEVGLSDLLQQRPARKKPSKKKRG
ncbi:MAG: stage 0 sporulation family protein [Deltaproteobacteria bacterium]|nr:stage 0 sporulation family protein [Deltaproteobacteria bacterium]MBW1948142.1 stage 0 sporulation family protein [Deltaproteobacteria bacterium]RLB36603.1 MAG: stage 0 sporulation protein [Deltaproteobacteria bacterium]